MKYCAECVTPNTRPRITFDEKGVCNACQWEKQKKKVNWHKRKKELKKYIFENVNLLQKHDCIVPCSGGKDGTYVAHKMKDEFDLNPLCITFAPQIQTKTGKENLENFKNSGFDHILISPDVNQYKRFAKDYFIKYGMPKQPFVTGISAAIIKLAYQMKINLIVYGEQGEQEYGGVSETITRMTPSFLSNYYYEGHDPSEYGIMWRKPDDFMINDLYVTWWSNYENWDSEHHAKFAKEKANLQMLVGGAIGTFTNYAQLDDVMQDIHAYCMFLKFGFGRCTSDASIEVRKGRMTRGDAFRAVMMIDGQFPIEHLQAYLSYFEMSEKDFWQVIDKLANKKLLVKTNQKERPYVLKSNIYHE